jgi:hypothetical protein
MPKAASPLDEAVRVVTNEEAVRRKIQLVTKQKTTRRR